MVGCSGWGAAAARPWPEGPLFELAQREEIALGRARGESVRSIAAALRRAPSTVSRELRRNGDRLGGYRATTAHALAYDRASGPGGMHHVRLPDWSLSVPLRHCAAYPDRARLRNHRSDGSRCAHVATEEIPG